MLLFTTCLLLAGAMAGAADEAAPALCAMDDPYQVQPVAIGGGGWWTGVAVHPRQPDVTFAWSDMCGPWRRDGDDQPWRILYWGEWQPGPAQSCVLGLAFDPRDDGTIYVDLGVSRWNPGLYRSTDGGRTWSRLKELVGQGLGAGQARKWGGSTIAIDPQNPAHLVYGTRKSGVFTSLDRGATWSAATMPGSEGANGVRCVLFAGSAVLASLDGAGALVSTDGGATFAADVGFAALPGRPLQVRDLIALADGAVLAAHERGLARRDPSGAWSDLTPPGAAGCNSLAADPRDAMRLLALGEFADKGNGVLRTIDGGRTWLPPLRFGYKSDNVLRGDLRAPWKQRLHVGMGGATRIALDPHRPGRAWNADCFTMWRCDNVWAERTTWTDQDQGAENIVGIAMHTPPAGPVLITGVSDVRGFAHASPFVPPSSFIMADKDWSTFVTSADSCESHPQTLYAAKFLVGKPPATVVLRSGNGGRDWSACTQPWPGVKAGGGKLAVAADAPDHLVIVPGVKELSPRWSADGGRTWQDARSEDGSPLPAGFTDHGWAFNYAVPIAADRTAPRTFYAYRAEGGTLWTSRDGGATWRRGADLPDHYPHDDCSPVVVATPPGRAGEVWIALGSKGIWRSTDYGATATRLPGFAGRPTLVAFGKEQPGSTPDKPTVYIWATAAGDTQAPLVDAGGNSISGGLYRSIDLGASWRRLPAQLTDPLRPRVMAADRQVFGRVYAFSTLSDSGYVLQINRQDPQLQAPARIEAGAGSETTIPVRVADAESDGQALLMQVVSSSDPSVLPVKAVRITGSGAERQLLVSPAASASGTAVLTVRLADGAYPGSRTAEARVTVAVR